MARVRYLPGLSPDPPKVPPKKQEVSAEQLVDAWNQKADQHPRLLSRVKLLTDKRRMAIATRVKKDPNFIEVFMAAIEMLPTDKKGLNWQPAFDWLLTNDTNVYKLLEGNYRNPQQESASELLTRIMKQDGAHDEDRF